MDADGLFEGLAQRRSHRERDRRVQSGLLAFAVLAATAVGFSALTGLFDPDGRGFPAITPYGAEGAIVICGDETGGQVCRIDAAALARGAASHDFVGLTDLPQGLVTSPAVSHDGTTVVFELHDPPGTSRQETAELWTIGTDGRRLQRLTPRGSGFTDPSWGPTGLLVGVASDGVSEDAALAILDPSSGPSPRMVTIDLPGLTFPSSPKWSPDNERILFSATAEPITDLYTVAIDGSDLTNLTNSPQTEYSPTWSPDGRSIAFWVGSPNGAEIRICSIGCADPRPLFDPEGGPIYGSLPVWSPDGSWIAFQVDSGPTTEVHAVRIDGSDERTLASPAGEIAWIPVGANGSTPSPEPSLAPSPQPEHEDRGFGFDICEVSQVQGQFDGVGAMDTAFVAIERDGGGCPSVQSASAHVGIDLDEDGLVDATYGPIACEVYYCRAFAAPDLDGDDNRRELFVVESAGTIVGLGVYALEAEAGSPENTEVVRIHIGEPDLAQNGFVTGEPARLFIGGDEGWSYRLRCEDHGVNRFIYQQRAFRQVDSAGPATVDETTVIYYQQRLDVFDAREPEQATSDDPLGPQPSEVCGAPIPAI